MYMSIYHNLVLYFFFDILLYLARAKVHKLTIIQSLYVCIYIYVYIYICMYIYICIYMYVCMYIYVCYSLFFLFFYLARAKVHKLTIIQSLFKNVEEDNVLYRPGEEPDTAFKRCVDEYKVTSHSISMTMMMFN
jgi:hypothetical protein